MIHNAIKYTIKGEVKVKTKIIKLGNTKRALIEIEDTGVGIDDHTQLNIFKLFDNYKVKNVVNSGGCGIGLTLTKKLCDLMNY